MQMTTKFLKAASIIILCLGIITFTTKNITFAANIGYDNEIEDNDTIDKATQINIGDYCSGAFYNAYDTDYYGFTLNESGNVTIKFDHAELQNDPNIYWKISLMDENKDEYKSIVSSGKDKSVEMKIGLAKGTYYLKIVPYSRDKSSGIEYKVCVNLNQSNYYEKEMNDKFDTATTMELNKPYTGALSTASDVDYYTFQLNQQGLVKLKFEHAYIADNLGEHWNVILLDKNQNEIASFKVNGQDRTSLNQVGLPIGCYYIKIFAPDEESLNDMNYTIESDYISYNNYEMEPNNNKNQATNLILDNLINGKINNDYDVDYYKFQLNEDGNIKIKFNHNSITNISDTYWKITLTDDNKEIYSSFYSSAQDNQTYRSIGLKKGKYYIIVQPASLDNVYNADYQIGVNFINGGYYEKEKNNFYSNATDLEIGKTYTGIINEKYDIDFYRFKLDEEKNVNLLFNPLQAEDWKITILKSDGISEVYKFSDNDNNIELSKGEYYVKVEPKSKNNINSEEYSVSINLNVDIKSTDEELNKFENNIDLKII
jgi:hypothetical protein